MEEDRRIPVGPELCVELWGALYGGRGSEVVVPLLSVEEKAGFLVEPGLCI